MSGTDQLAAEGALRRGWELVAPLPFGKALNLAINAHPATVTDANALLRDEVPASAETAARANAIRTLYEKALLFELCDRDGHNETA